MLYHDFRAGFTVLFSKLFFMTIWFVIRLHFFLSLSDLDNLGCYKSRLHVLLCVDEEELPESEEDFPDL